MKRIFLIAFFLIACEQDVDNIFYHQEETNNMALNPSTNTEYTGRIKAPDSDYPYGSAQDESTSGADDGTPNTAKFRSDVWGFLQGLLQKASIVPDGDPDVAAGQYRDALDTMPISLTQLADGETSIDDGTFSLLLKSEYINFAYDALGTSSAVGVFNIIHTAEPGTNYNLTTKLVEGGIRFGGEIGGDVPGDNVMSIRADEYDIDMTGYTVTDGIASKTFSTSMALTGIPVDTNVHSVSIGCTDTGANAGIANVAIEFDYSSTYLAVKNIKWLNIVSFPNSGTLLKVFYDPSLVD